MHACQTPSPQQTVTLTPPAPTLPDSATPSPVKQTNPPNNSSHQDTSTTIE